MPTNNLTNSTNEGTQGLPPNPDNSHTVDSVPENQTVAVEPSVTVKKNMNLRFKRNDKEEWNTGKLYSRAGKTTGKYPNAWNVQSKSGTESVDVDRDVSTWEEVSIENALLCGEENCDDLIINTILQMKTEDDISLAKEKELTNWREQGVYEEVGDMGHSCITTRCVLKTKMVNTQETVKAQLCTRGFQELQDFHTDSPTCSQESVCIAFPMIASNGWTLNSIDVKTAFLQGKCIERTMFIHPPKEAKTNKILRLRKCFYGLADAPRQWYLHVRKELIKLKSRPSDLDAALFCWFSDGTLVGILICFVDDMIWGGTQSFKVNVIDNLCKVFEIGSVNYRILKYIGIDVKQNPDYSITVNQNSFASTIQQITIPKERLTNKETRVDQEETKLLRGVIGQLNWLAGITRPDISYDV